jgi:hypothetical protein
MSSIVKPKKQGVKNIFKIILAVIFFMGCKKNNSTDTACREFVKGDIIVGIDSTVQLEQLFGFVNPLNLYIDELMGYHYTTTISKDSIPYIKAILNSKPYINSRQFSASVRAHYQTQIVRNTTMLWDMTPANQQDYIQTLNTLFMTDELSTTKCMLLKVPVGQEQYWIDIFNSFSWVSWTEVNCIGGFLLHG